MRVFSGKPVGVLVHVEGPQQDAASSFHALYKKRISGCRGIVTIDFGACERDHAFYIEQIFTA